MNVLLVYAHPEPTSLNGTLKAFTVEHLQRAGHTVQVSDLHAMQWKAQIDADDHIGRDASLPFHASLDSREAFRTGRQSADIAAEQEKLRWADAVILQFPLWWFSMPAILKGWWIACTPMVLPMAWANIPTGTGAIAMAKVRCPASARCWW